ncbi:PTS glucose transporter subunit IIA [Vagococcus fluvialis]|nr:PTS glucose transporter subunit IIA [Vagococcus fluvialis]
MLDENNEEFEVLGKTAIEKEEQLAIIVKGLGGVSNIEEIFNCYSRLRLDVYDDKKVDINLLKKYSSSGVVDKQKHIQIVIGIGVEDTRINLENYVADLKAGRKKLPVDLEITNQPQTVQLKNDSNGVLYPAAVGEVVSLNQVNDSVFSTCMMGNDYGVTKHDGQIYASVSGKVVSIFPTKHAICIEDLIGNQILIHMGIDTVELSDEPFDVLVNEGQSVEQGEKIASMDQLLLKEKKKDDIVIVINLENNNGEIVNIGNNDLENIVFKFKNNS